MGHWTPVLALVPVLLVAVFFPLQADTESQSSYTSASCFRKETYNTTSKVKVQIPVNKTRYDWCLGGFMRCMVYKVEMAEKEINVTEIRSRIVEMCCPGTIPAPGTPAQSTNESLQCIPAPGSATSPIAAIASTTVVTTTPREVCKAGLWGRGCAHRCLCDGHPCDQDTGICKQCSPNDKSCAPLLTSASSTTTTTTSTSPVPTIPSTSSSTTILTTPSSTTTSTTTTTTPSTLVSTLSTTTSTTMISTLATTKMSTHRTVETSPSASPSNAPEIPVAASTESPRTVSTTPSTTKTTEFTTVRPVVATREHGTIERRKEVPGKSMAQPAKTTALLIDPEAVNRVDISPGNGKPKPNSVPTNTSSIISLPSTSTIYQNPTSPSTHPTYPISPSTSFSVPLTTTPKPSATILTSTSRLTLAAQVSTTPKPLLKQTTSKPNDSSEESDSDEGDDSDDDDDDDDTDDDDVDEEDLSENKDFKKMRKETILSPPEKTSTRIDKIQTKINGSQHLMTWTFQTDFSVGPPIKYGTPPPRKNAISPGTETRNASLPVLDKNTDEKIGATTATYDVKPWIPALSLATEGPRLNEQTRLNLDNEKNSLDKPPTVQTSTQSSTIPSTVFTLTTAQTVSTSTIQTSTLKSTTLTAKAENRTEALNFTTENAKFSSPVTFVDTSTTSNNQNRTSAPIEASSAQTSAPIEASSAQTSAPIGASSAQTSAPIEASSDRTSAPIEASSARTSAPIETSSAQTSILTSIVSGTFSTAQNTTTSTILIPITQPAPIESSTKPKGAPSTISSTSMTTPTNSTTLSIQLFTSQTPSSTFQTPSFTSETPTFTSQTPSSTFQTNTTLKVPSITIPAEPPPVSVQTVSSTVEFTSSTLGQTPLQGHIDEPSAGVDRGFSVQYSVTSPRSVDISPLGSPPRGGIPNNPSATGSGAAGAAVAAVAIALAILAILCVLIIFVQTRNQRSKRRPGVAPPPSPPLISAWHSVPHYSDTFAASTVGVGIAASTQPASANQPRFSDQFEQPAVEHVYQEITPLANVTETLTQPTGSSTPTQDTGPTKVMVKLRNVETYTVVR